MIIHYNNPTALQKSINNFVGVGIDACDIIVYDNGSSQENKILLKDVIDKSGIACIYGSCNLGWGGAINQFIDCQTWLDDDILAISAHDTLLAKYDPNVFEKEFSDSSIMVLCPDYPSPERCHYSIARGFRCRHINFHSRSEVVIGHATLCYVRPEILKAIRYDENFFIYGCESEIFLRINDFGLKTIITDQIIVVNPSTDASSDFRELAFSINSLYCARLRGGWSGYCVRLVVISISLFRWKNYSRLKMMYARISGIIFSLKTGGAGFKEYLQQRGGRL
jgi:glycosyltransferase involved in cell wall biosynthesis